MKLRVLTNDVEPRTETEDGREYTVVPIRFIKNTSLHKGYVPADEIRKATMRWDGTPIVSDHPQRNGRFVSAEAGEKAVIGELREPRSIVTNDTVTMAEAWIAHDAVEDAEDEAVLAAIRNEETLSVSSAYVGELLPAGEYDGAHREQVRGNLQPDHVAVFEDKEGRCSVADGCFVGPRADLSEDEVMVNVAPSADDGGAPDGTDDSGDSDEGLAGNRDDSRRPTRSDQSDRSGIRDRVLGVLDSLGLKPEASMSKTDTLVNEHNFDRENLPPEDTECFTRIFEQFAANDDNDDGDRSGTADASDSGQGDAGAQPDDQTDNSDDTMDTAQMKEVLSETLDEKGFVKQEDIGEAVTEAMAANRTRNEKETLVEDLIANSDRYDEADRDELMDYPKSALSDLTDTIEADEKTANYAAMRGGSANSAGDEIDVESWPSPTVDVGTEADD